MADLFPDDDQIGTCNDCTYFDRYTEGGRYGECTRIYGSLPIHGLPMVYKDCWCSWFVAAE